MLTKEYLIADNFHAVGFLWIMQGWRLSAWEVLKEIVPHSLELKERIPYPVRLDEVPCKERLLKEKKGRKSIASVAQLQLELQRWRLQQWCHTQYWITLLPLAMASSGVWLWHVASWPTTNTTNAQAKSMATPTSCATSVATFGKAARRKAEERHRGSSRKTFYPFDPFYCCHRSWCCLTTRRKTAMTSTATAT